MTPIDPVERHLFLEGIFLKYGYDFRQYAEASLDRRLQSILADFKATSLVTVLQYILASNANFREVLPRLTINTTEFFRDPSFFRALREQVFATLKTYPRPLIWIAGCSTGEEILSVAITLKEEGLLKRTIIHATDINPTVLQTARGGIYELSSMQSFSKNYAAAGGTGDPSQYFTAEYGLARFDPTLLENVVFSEHNLGTDAPFVAAQLILCRNVLIYFNRELQDRAFHLFVRSLDTRGILGIGSKESLRFSSASPYFDALDLHNNLYGLKLQAVSEEGLVKPRGAQ